ncbi:MAG: hypothetical protein Ct9H90mP15_07390 [Candidatus Neomarinimicrobiota bacterium]|nr:MAG: hypothetical protein Ct9H90mP15_07390 [Candidatus Neomarinimicrobiota bacterium]
MKEGDDFPNQYDLSSLRVLGTVGEPIKSPEWHWYFQVIGKEKCPIVDTWWQTETGGILMSPIPGWFQQNQVQLHCPYLVLSLHCSMKMEIQLPIKYNRIFSDDTVVARTNAHCLWRSSTL